MNQQLTLFYYLCSLFCNDKINPLNEMNPHQTQERKNDYPKFINSDIQQIQQDEFHKFLKLQNGLPKLNNTLQEKLTNHHQFDNNEIVLVQEVNEPLDLDTNYDILRSGSLMITDKIASQNLLILTQGYSNLKIILIGTNNKEPVVKVEKITFWDFYHSYYIPIDKLYLQSNIGGYIEFIVENNVSKIVSEMMIDSEKQKQQSKFIRIMQKEEIEMNILDSINIATNFINLLHIKVVSNINLENNPQPSRFLFYVNTNLSLQALTNDQNLQMFINQGQDYPNKDSFLFEGNFNIQNWLISSINSDSQYFCKIKGCFYSVSIDTYGIDHMSFMVLHQNQQVSLKLDHKLEIFNEIDEKEELLYQIAYQQQRDQLFQINYIPVGKELNWTLNLDNFNSEKSIINTYDSESTTRYLVTNNYINQYENNSQKFFLKFFIKDKISSGGFWFNMFVFDNLKQNLQLKLNNWININISQGEILEFSLELESEKLTDYFLRVEDILFDGNFDVYFKNCENIHLMCDIKEEEQEQLKKGKQVDSILNFKSTTDQGLNILNFFQAFNFRCKGRQFDNTKSNYKGDQFLFCNFKLFFYGRENKNSLQFRVLGEVVPTTLALDHTTNIKLNAQEQVVFQVPISLKQSKSYKYLFIKAVNLIGSCRIFFSNSKDIDKDNNASKIEFKRYNHKSIHMLEKKYNYEINEVNDFIYITVETQTYTVIDLYVALLNSPEYDFQIIKPNMITHRAFAKELSTLIDLNILFYSNFLLKMADIEGDQIQIILNSTIQGIDICAQWDRDIIESSKECDFFTEKMVLEIDYKQQIKRSKLAIQVQKKYNLQKEILNENAQFNITVRNNMQNQGKISKLELFQAGTIFSHFIKAQQQQFFKIDFSQMSQQGMISLTTFNANIKAHIYSLNGISEETIIAELNSSDFALVFYNNIFEKDQKNLIVKVTNESPKKSARFSITYTYDEIPINLIEGRTTYFPETLKFYFTLKNSQMFVFNLNVESVNVDFQSYLKINENEEESIEISKKVNTQNFDYKTDFSLNSHISIPQKIISQLSVKSIDILFYPKEEVFVQESKVYSFNQRAMISVETEFKEVFPFEYYEQTCEINEFKFFMFSIDNVVDQILVNLMIMNGEADLYINKGRSVLPSLEVFWLKSTKYKGDQIQIVKEQFDKQEEIIGVYSIGVYCREQSKFSISYVEDFGLVVNAQYQKLITLDILPFQYYYITYTNIKESSQTYLFSTLSDIKINTLTYNQENFIDPIQLMTKDENYTEKYIFTRGQYPIKKNIETSNFKDYFILRILAQEKTSLIFSIFTKKNPLQIMSERRVLFQLQQNEEQIFKSDFDQQYEIIECDIQLKSGKLKFMIGSQVDQWTDDWIEINQPDQQITQIFKKQSNEDIIIFNSVYVKVQGLNRCDFTLLLRPKNKFKELVIYQPELLYTDQEQDQYLYLEISSKDIDVYNLLEFEIKIPNNNIKLNPELYYLPSDNKTLNSKSPYLPMPVMDYITNQEFQFKILVIRPQIQTGFYIIKIASSKIKFPIRITTTVNNRRNLQNNGFHQQYITHNKDQISLFSMYLPSKGLLRIELSNCQKYEIIFSVMISDHEEEVIQMELDQNQKIKYFYYNTLSFPKQLQSHQIQMTSYLTEIKREGLFLFQIKNNSQSQSYVSNNTFYEISTHFNQDNQGLSLRDYFESEFDTSFFNYEFQNKNSNLLLQVKAPSFKKQLFDDFPELRKLRVVYEFFFVDNKSGIFEDQCLKYGYDEIERYTIFKKQTQRIYQKSHLDKELIVPLKFIEEELQQFDSFSSLTIFIVLKITFIEKEEDYFGITLNEKFLVQPYGIVIIKNNRYYGMGLWKYLVIIIIFIISIYLWKYKNKIHLQYNAIKRRRINYENSQIEISDKISFSNSQNNNI